MRSPGVTVRPILDMTGSRHFCEVFFEDVRVPAGHLVGDLNGSFRQVMRQMEHERGGIDRLVSNRRLYDDVRPLADGSDPLVRQEIAAIETGYRIGRLLVLRETLGQAPSQFSAATKTFCTELEQRIAGFCVRVLGPRRCWPSRAWPTGSAATSAMPRLHDHGRHVADPAQHPGRAHPGPAPRAPARLSRRLRAQAPDGSRVRRVPPVATGGGPGPYRLDWRRPQPGIDPRRATR